jgi:hypothetical protein
MKWSEVNYNLDQFTCSVVFDLPPDKFHNPMQFFNVQGQIHCPYGSIALLKNPNTHKMRVIPPYATVYNLISPHQPDTHW